VEAYLYSWLCINLLWQLGKLQGIKGHCDEDEDEDGDLDGRANFEFFCESDEIVS
jgi:hypothetical protein